MVSDNVELSDVAILHVDNEDAVLANEILSPSNFECPLSKWLELCTFAVFKLFILFSLLLLFTLSSVDVGVTVICVVEIDPFCDKDDDTVDPDEDEIVEYGEIFELDDEMVE